LTGKFRIIPKLDPRIASALSEQRKPILKGLVCTALGAIIAAGMIPLTERTINAIQRAAPMRVDLKQAQPYESELSKALGIRVEIVREAIQVGTKKSRLPTDILPPAEVLADELKVSQEQVDRAYAGLGEDEKPSSPEQQNDALHDLGLLCLGVIGLFGLKYTFTRGQAYYLSYAANKLAANLRVKMYAKLQRVPMHYFANKRVGGLQSILTNDINVYQTAVTVIRDSIDGPFKAISALIAIFIIQWQLALLALMFVPFLAWFVQRNGQKMKRDQTQVQENLAHLGAFTNEALGGVRVVKAFAAEGTMMRMYQDNVDTSFKSQMRAARRFAQLKPMVELIGAVSLATILYVCGHMARAGTLQISQIVALTFALDVINQGFRSLSNVSNTLSSVQAAADRIYGEILDQPDEESTLGKGRVLENVQGRIAFENVEFSYPDGTQALNSVSFLIEPGTSLALVGPSGAGKSTIADLLLRFHDPSSGRITLDGVDIRELDLQWLRSQFGVVPQQTFLFAGTIEDNLKLSRQNATEAELREATRIAHANGFIDASIHGLQTVLGERGAKVSGGEAQRLAIARALVGNPKLMLLDEATSNLDAESERAVTEAMDEVMVGRTTILIAHRLTTAMRASDILVLRKGAAIESGKPQELVQRQGVFSDMWRTFNHGMIEGEVG
jgi:ATP-binding cassette, subfamily B, bacterial MsbA